MSEKKEHILPLYHLNRNLHGVMISPELWSKVEDDIWPILEKALLAMGDESVVCAFFRKIKKSSRN